jgi:tetratricopeptide (TPR) repeat protein
MGCRNNQRIRITLFVALLVLSGSSGATKAAGQAADSAALQHFAAAHKAQDAGDLDQAAREYIEVIHLLPQAAEAYASLGLVYNAQGKFPESARALAKADRLKPGLPGVSLYLGIDYEQQRQATAAVPRLVEAVHRDAASKDANVWLGRALWDEGKTQESLVQLQKSSMLFPADPALLLELGEAYHKAAEAGVQRVLEAASSTALQHQIYGDIYKDEHAWENAMAHYYRALELDPHWPGAHLGLGDVALHRDKLSVAEQEYHQELNSHPGSAAALARLGEVALLMGKRDDSLSLFANAVQKSGDEAASALGLPRAYPPNSEEVSASGQAQLRQCLPAVQGLPASPARSLALAFAYARLGDREGFAAAWSTFTQATPRRVFPAAYERGVADFYRQDFAAAASALDAVRKTHPNDLRAEYLLATAYRNLSLNTLEQLLTVAPDSYPAHELQAEAYQNAEQDAKALGEYRLVAGIAPDLPGIHSSIGHLLHKAGQQEQAREEFTAELRAHPDDAGANAELGTILLEQQEVEKAIPYLEKAIKSDPDLWTTYNQLGKAYYAQKEYPKAEAALQQAIRHDSQGQAHYQLGLVYRSLGQKQAANAQFEISRKLKLEALTHDETTMTTLKDMPQ